MVAMQPQSALQHNLFFIFDLFCSVLQIAPNLYAKAVASAEAAKSAQQKSANGSAKSSSQVNYVSSVSSLLAAQEQEEEQQQQQQGIETREEEVEVEVRPAETALMCKVVVPSAFSQSGQDSVVPVRVLPGTSLQAVHDHLLQASSLLLGDGTSGNGSGNGGGSGDDYWYSFKSSMDTRIDFQASLGALRDLMKGQSSAGGSSASDDLLIVLHKQRPAPQPSTSSSSSSSSSSSNPIIAVHIFDCTARGDAATATTAAESELATVKVNITHKCRKLMTTMASQCFQRPVEQLVFLAHMSGRVVQLRPEVTFQALGVGTSAHIRIEVKK
jgi:hypothetical protein